MSLPLLQTKLYAPRRPRQAKIVHRPRLAKKLATGLVGKVTLIAAPAGFGKSTLLTEWMATFSPQVHASGEWVAWLALDPDDNDPVRFLTYLMTVLQKFATTVGETALALLSAPQLLAPKTILTLLVNDLTLLANENSPPSHPYVLVLEDYHVITAQPIHEALTFLIDHLPAHVHVIITTRADPPLPLARWRARDQLSEIRADDMRFTRDETTAFLNDLMGLSLAADDVMTLGTRTEGWIAGLQLVALSLIGRDDKASFLQTFSGGHRYILNYLIEEVLNLQSSAVQDFLLNTSILDRLCGPLCDSLFAPDLVYPNHRKFDSQVILEQLYHANLFLVPLDDEGQWYRYHQLFAEVLQHRLRQSQPDLLPTLHRRASAWYRQNSLFADAIRHALLAADFMHAAELIEQIWLTTWNQGTVTTLLHWVQALPQVALVEHPTLWVSYAWALAFTGQIEAAEACLLQVEAMLQISGDASGAALAERNTLLGRAVALRAMLAARRGQPVAAIQLAQYSLTLLPEDALLLRGNACFALGLAYQQNGALPEALLAYQDTVKLSGAADDIFLTVAARYHAARTGMAQGNLRVAAASYQQLLALATPHSRQLPVVGLAYVGYAEILYQWNDLAGADQQVEIGLALSPPSDLTYIDGPLHRFSILARIRQARGDREGTLAALQLAKATARQTGIALDGDRATALEALMHLRLGQPALANQWAQIYVQTLTEEEQLSYLHEFETLVFVRVLLAQERVDEVLALLGRMLPSAEAVQRLGSMIEMLMLQAMTLGAKGQTDAAMQPLTRALALAEPEGYVRLFVDEGELMRLPMAALEKRDLAPRLRLYVDKLVTAFAPQPLPSTALANANMRKPAIQKLVEPLSQREREVLHLIAAGLSNTAIAEQLVVSVGTVKTHLKHIYGKLAVQSRTQAIAQARTLGLL
ncbi:MAG: LuxR C-terminal-related transcriptional regulator [Chloroflexi bacterium]|nr:LuxR C-terminal-related transcriptional regulator [Chloroflexota bacterium]